MTATPARAQEPAAPAQAVPAPVYEPPGPEGALGARYTSPELPVTVHDLLELAQRV